MFFFFACTLNIWQLLIVFHLAPTVVCSLTSARVIKNACIHLINTGEQVVSEKKKKNKKKSSTCCFEDYFLCQCRKLMFWK